MPKSTKPCLVINLIISIIILIITVVCSTIVMMTCADDDCNKFVYAIVPMCLLSTSLLGFTVWCIFYVKKDDKKQMTISHPISAYPECMFSSRQPPQYQPPSTFTGPYKSVASSRSSQSGYDQYRQRAEFEKRLLLEPRYVVEEGGNYVSQSNIYASQARLANRSASQGRLSRAASIRTTTENSRQCPTCTSQILNTSTTSTKLSPILSRSHDKRYDTTDSFTYHTVVKN